MDGDGVTVTYSVAVGDVVEVDQLIAEIESDKATIEVNAPSEGVIAELHLEAGKEQDITTDTAVATLMTRDQRTTGEDDMASVKARTSATPVEGSEKSVVSGFVDAQGAQFKKLKQTGDHVEAGDVIAVSEKDGVRQKLTAPTSGQLTSFYIDELDSADDIREAKLFSIDKSIKAASKGALDQAATTPADKGNSQTVALSRAKLAMVQNMTVQGGDTIPFVLQEVVDFNRVATLGKMADVSPIAVLVRCLAEAASETGFNQKLNRNRDSITMFNNVNIGVAVEVEGQLRVAVVHDVLKKSLSEIMTDIRGYASKGAKLSAADQDLSQVCWVVSSMGKHATSAVIPVLPKGCTGIVGVGRTSKNGESTLSLTIDHATLTGMQGAELVRSYVQKLGPA
jgi:pyruvate dehydrogenase E2 component (dihydrolipoamide acetyltransferase)